MPKDIPSTISLARTSFSPIAVCSLNFHTFFLSLFAFLFFFLFLNAPFAWRGRGGFFAQPNVVLEKARDISFILGSAELPDYTG